MRENAAWRQSISQCLNSGGKTKHNVSLYLYIYITGHTITYIKKRNLYAVNLSINLAYFPANTLAIDIFMREKITEGKECYRRRNSSIRTSGRCGVAWEPFPVMVIKLTRGPKEICRRPTSVICSLTDLMMWFLATFPPHARLTQHSHHTISPQQPPWLLSNSPQLSCPPPSPGLSSTSGGSINITAVRKNVRNTKISGPTQSAVSDSLSPTVLEDCTQLYRLYLQPKPDDCPCPVEDVVPGNL